MTSAVKVSAHCAPTKEVVVIVNDDGVKNEYASKVLQNGETADFYIHDVRTIKTYEQDKT